MFSNSSGFKTRILTVVAMGLASSVAGHAVTNFNAPNATLVSSCSAFAVTGNGTLSGVVANNGHGISVSGNGSLRRTAPVNDCLTLHWAGTGSGPFDASTLPALYDFTITAPGNGFVTGWNLTFTANPGINQVATPFSCQVQESQPLSPMRSMAVLPRAQVSQVCNGVTSFRNQTVNVPAGVTMTGWAIDLQISAFWQDDSGGTLSVVVPFAGSVNINAPLGSVPVAGVPALSPILLSITAIALLALGIAGSRKWRTS
jgi:hypothetical protein